MTLDLPKLSSIQKGTSSMTEVKTFSYKSISSALYDQFCKGSSVVCTEIA